jgi:hypothetical protein
MKDGPLSTWRAYFERIGVTLFNPILNNAPETDDVKCAQAKDDILFILCAFDEGSPMVVSRQDATEEKRHICDYLNIPEYRREGLIYLKDTLIRRCATDYLMEFAGEVFRNYMFMKIQLMDFDLIITNRDFLTDKKESEDGKEIHCHYDIKEHLKAIQQREILSRQILKTENDIRQQVRLIGIEAMKEHKEKSAREAPRVSRKGFPESRVEGSGN